MPTDYKYTAELDLDITGGDFHRVDATLQHQRSLLQAVKGDFKQSPLTGVGIANYLLDERPGNLPDDIRKGFAADGMTVNDVNISDSGTVTIDAYYNE